MPADIRHLQRRGHFDTEWNSGRVRNIEVGSRAFLIRVGVPPKGVFGAGYTLTAPVPTIHWRPEKAAKGAMQQRLTLRLEALHPLPLITYDDLGVPPFARFRWGVRSSGVRIPSTLAELLEALWEERTASAIKAGPGGLPRRARRG